MRELGAGFLGIAVGAFIVIQLASPTLRKALDQVAELGDQLRACEARAVSP